MSLMYVAQEEPYKLMWFIESQIIPKNGKKKCRIIDKLKCDKLCDNRKNNITCYNKNCPAPKQLLKGRKYIVVVSGVATFQEVNPLNFEN
ncbi:MAG: hypothetical protein KDK36_06790 [Leptospiraceae bacterium]|nr:hypothetical protein [Leptospiraceae bacterium]